ncbi:hypothetical protein NLX67_12010 [Domibacillus sp. A3M-37]|nr:MULTISPECIES: hypothetical protein [Domibacillus]MCP3763107.1 hypothetical protein [Domibacillus sp. A3M-37]
MPLMFKKVSAFAPVGLSMNLTLPLAYMFAKKQDTHFKYASEDVQTG